MHVSLISVVEAMLWYGGMAVAALLVGFGLVLVVGALAPRRKGN
jgi:hypothetical protein